MRSSPLLTLLVPAALGLVVPAARAQDVLWSQTYGLDSHEDGSYALEVTDDGGYILAGYTTTTQGVEDFRLTKTDAAGNEEWTQIWGGVFTDWGFSVRVLPDGGYLMAGKKGTHSGTRSDAYLARTDSFGNLLWERQYGDDGVDERAHAVWLTSDGGYILAGQQRVGVFPFDSYDIWLIKTDADGILEWDRLFAHDEFGNDVGLAVLETSDGGYAIAGETQSSVWACWLLRTDALGNLLWDRTFGGVQGRCNDARETADGGLILAGEYYDFDIGSQSLLVRTDADGNPLWQRTYGVIGGVQDSDVAQSIIELPDGGFAVAGHVSYDHATGWDLAVLRTDANGNEQWTRTFGAEADDRGWSIVRSPRGSLGVAGWLGTPDGPPWLQVLLMELSDGIFADGFESGDASAWDQVQP